MTGPSGSKPGQAVAEQPIDETFALRVLPRRERGAHKWGVGGVILIAGGPSYIGAAALSAMAAGRSGAGIVNVAVSRGAIGAIAALVPEVAFIPLHEGDLDASWRRAREAISAKLSRSKAAVIGPGLGEDEYVDRLLAMVLGRPKARRSSGVGFRRHDEREQLGQDGDQAPLLGGGIPCVVDADALNWLAKQPEWWTLMEPASLVLTPHVGEMARLTGMTTDEIRSNPVRIAQESATSWRQIVVLKGAPSIATDGSTTLTATDAPRSLASAGTGDVLAGSIGAFLAQGVAPLEAAGLGVYLGLMAARRIEARYGELGLIASDLPSAIGEEIAHLERKRDDQRG